MRDVYVREQSWLSWEDPTDQTVDNTLFPSDLPSPGGNLTASTPSGDGLDKSIVY